MTTSLTYLLRTGPGLLFHWLPQSLEEKWSKTFVCRYSGTFWFRTAHFGKNGRWWYTALDNLIFTSQRRIFPYFQENWLCLVLETKHCGFIAEEVTARENKSFAREPESESWSLEVSFSALTPRLLFHSQLCIKVHSLLTPPKSLSIPLHFEPPSWSFTRVLVVLAEC